MTRISFSVLLLGLLIGSAGCLKADDSSPASSCVPNPSGTPTSNEIAAVQSYLTAHSISATLDSRGFYYVIVNPGTGATPGLSSTVTVRYTGTLENGNVFDQNLNGAVFTLSQLIRGWQYGLPLIKKGGTIRLYLPPTLGYGCNNITGIPPGSDLIFSIDLVDVQ